MLITEKFNAVAGLLHINLDAALRNCVKQTIARCTNIGTVPQEPDFIAGMVIDFTPDLGKILSAVIPGVKFAVSSVYCHQKPLADYGSTPMPEIGDILFAFIYTDDRGNKYYNALLFQAKISQSPNFTVAAGEQHQLNLYTKWPRFTYRRAGGLNGTVRDIQPKVASAAAQYLLIDDHPRLGLSGAPGTFPFGCSIPNSTIVLNAPLYDELFNFFKFKTGRVFDERHTGLVDEWSHMIWDLIDIAKTKASKRKNSGLKSFPRLNVAESDGLAFLQTNSSSIFHDIQRQIDAGDIKDDNLDFTDEDGGVSVILIEGSTVG